LNDFEDFYNTEYLTLNGNNSIINTKYSLVFNHESPNHFHILGGNERWSGDDHFIKNNFALFRERYKRRLMNFKQYIEQAIKDGTIIIFVICRYNSLPVELDDIIKYKYPMLNYKIACINNIDRNLELNTYIKNGFHEDDKELERFKIPFNEIESTGNFLSLRDLQQYVEFSLNQTI
jgi:hypothetical protein